jgi:hypothetical protein
VRAWLLELRHEGVRIQGERAAADWVEGFVSCDLRRSRTRCFDCVVFRRVLDPHPMPNWRELFEPQITSIGGGSIWLRGIVRAGGAAVLQEWRLDVQRTVKPGGHCGPPLGEIPPSR